jgi:NAD-dependent SIR2 family protein deacetylase
MSCGRGNKEVIVLKNKYDYLPNGYQESIRKGLDALRVFKRVSDGIGTKTDQIQKLKTELKTAAAIVIGAGAGLSASAGFTYSGERFEQYFFDFKRRFGIQDMYSGGFYPFTDAETRWAWWARHIYFNRYIEAPKPVYSDLLKLVKDKEYYVITTNVDHQFQRAGFDKNRLFYTQGDYGLFQSVNRNLQKTYDNKEWVLQAMEAQGFVKNDKGEFQVPDDQNIQMRIPSALIPKCPDDGSDVVMNLRSDDSFVEDEGWHRASAAYYDFLKKHESDHVLYLELGVGGNTPVIVKYPFWQMTLANDKAVYACLNYREASCPEEIAVQSVCIDADIGDILKELQD